MSEYVSISDFAEALRALPEGDPCDPDMIDTLRRYRVDPHELQRYVVWNDAHYTRHLVYRDRRFQVILLGWGVGQVTPIHDHAGQRCWMMIESGSLQISDFRWQQGHGAPVPLHKEIIGGNGDDMHLDRCACVHRIANLPEWGERAISLHVYSRPFERCGIYCADTGRREMVDLAFDSVGPHAYAAAV